MRFKKAIYSVLILILFFSFSFALAAEFRVGTKEGASVTVDKGEKVKNLYAGGNMVSINGDVEKSLYAGGNIITINGNVEDSVNVGGGTIVIRGNVGDSVHAGGGNILIEGEIKEDLFLGGGNITITKSASIGGDLILGGGNVEINGPIAGDILLGGGNVTINSKIGGKVKASADELKLGPLAEIGGNLNYTSPKEVKMDEDARVLGEIKFNKRQIKKLGLGEKTGTLFGILTLAFLIKVLMAIAAGLILIYLLKGVSEKVIRGGLTRFWKSLGFGFSALILTPIAALIILITVIGAWLSGLIMVAYILMLLLAGTLANVAFGSWLIKIVKKKEGYPINWQAVVIGVISLKIITLIPFVGWLVGLVFCLIALGALYRMIYQNLIIRK